MITSNKELVLASIFDFFVKSHDFNGITLTGVSKETNVSYGEVVEVVKDLVSEGEVSIQADINPHIIALGHYEINWQLEILNDAKENVTTVLAKVGNTEFVSDSHSVCVYPSPNYLKRNRDISDFSGRPYAARLSLGEAHLSPCFFEIDVLDRYYRDPRYRFEFDNYSGQISYHVDENEVPSVDEKDQVFLKTFGIGQDENGDRVAVAYLRYLNDLTAEHQAYWKSKESIYKGRVLQEYYDNTMGLWTHSYSVFSAFIGEQKALNDLAIAIAGVPLFKKTFEDKFQPKEFTFFFIPTSKNYEDFVLLLDKMLSDNLNKEFFSQQGVELFELRELGSNMVERKEKGTLRLFEEWLLGFYAHDNPEILKEIFKPFKNIRRERQNPAHKINENVYDKELFKRQLEVVGAAYKSLHYLRHIFSQHPSTKDVVIPNWLDEGEIKAF